MKFKCLKRFLSGSLAAMLTLSLCNMLPVIAEEMDNLSYYTSLDANSEEYQNWKASMATNETEQVATFSFKNASNGIYNDYLELICYGGNYSLGTTGGNPESTSDNNARLLYGYPGSGTSYTTIRIDGCDYKFSPSSITYGENVIVASNTYDNVMVSLCFSLVYNQYTGRDDVAEFYYTIENTDETVHNVGIRIMFDTMLGNNDSSPFRLPGIGDVTTETDLKGDDVPEFWQSFDSLTSPKVIAQGTLKIDDVSTPDRVRFTNWSIASSNPWDYTRTVGSSNGDSAVCLYWNPKTITNGDVFKCSTYYGLSSLQQDGTPPLAVALTGATKLEVEHNPNETDSYNPNPFTVTAYIQNIGDGDAQNVSARLNLPSDMTIVEGVETVDLGDLAVNSSQKQVSWKVWVEPNSISSIKSYSVTVSASNVDAKTIQRNVEIPALQTNGPLKLYFYRSKLNNVSNNLEIDFTLENSSNNDVNLSNYKVRYYLIDENPDLEKTIEKYYCGNQYNNSVKVNVSYHEISAPYKNNANAYLEFDFSESNVTLHAGDHLRVYYAMHSKNWSSINILNDFSAIDNNYNNESGLILWTKIPVYEKNSNKKVWGNEPQNSSEVNIPSMDIYCSANILNNDSSVDMIITLKNTSTTPIYLSNSELTYYYMNDNEFSQNVNIHYAGGRINGDWISITDKISGEAMLLETKKDRANSKIRLLFNSISGALCYNESIDIHLQLSNENWVQGKLDLSNDYSYAGITNSNLIANNILFTANYLNNNGDYAEFHYGEPIGDYHPTFSAFKIGEGTENENSLQDFENFINYFSNDFKGIKYDDYAIAENITTNFTFTNKNLNSLLGSDIAYISGHGSKGGVIPIYSSGIRPDCSAAEGELLYTQILTTDKNVGIDFQNFGVFETEFFVNGNINPNFTKSSIDSNNVFSVNMKDHLNENINDNLQWIITAACSQVNKQDKENNTGDTNLSSTDRWVDVLINNKNLKGILGYHGQAPSANAIHPDYQVIDDFLLYSSPELADYERLNIHDAWIKANAFYSKHIFPDTLPCGLIVKEHYDDDCLYDSLISNDEISCDFIYRYTARYIKNDDIGLGYVSYDYEMITETINAIRKYYGNSVNVSEDVMAIDMETFSSSGELLSDDIDEYIFDVSINDELTSNRMVKTTNISTDKLVRYNPETKSIEELS